MGHWTQPRVMRGDDGKYYLVIARYEAGEPRARCGIFSTDLHNGTESVEQLRSYAKTMLEACDKPVISTKEFELEPPDEDDEEEEDFCLSDLGPD